MTMDLADRWALLRLWHFEAVESELEAAAVQVFTRTSYVSAPRGWRALSAPELTARLEQLLSAHYRARAFSMRGALDLSPVVPFGYDFEWVTRAEMAPERAPERADTAPWMFPRAKVNPALVERARAEVRRRRGEARPGSAGRWCDEAFTVFRVDEDDRWQLLRRYQHASLLAARHEQGERRGDAPAHGRGDGRPADERGRRRTSGAMAAVAGEGREAELP